MSTINAISIIQDALEANGAYQPGETITDADVERALIVLNDMMDLWSNSSLACFANLQQSVVLVNNQQQYFIGPGAPDIDGVRPLQITQAYLVDNLGNNYPIEVITQQDWNNIGNRMVTSQLPTALFYDPQDPIGILNVFPVPVQPLYTMYWTSYLQLTEFPNLSTGINFPKGYVGAIKPNLSVMLCPYFGLQVDPMLQKRADEALATIKRTNMKSQVSYYDAEIVARAGNTFNVLTGSWNVRGGSQ